jgi:hypothetical protein|tara:strand:- start:1328 stop:1546 length:219 start_codon:yes stop_codon:yes gene_type:complete
MRYVKSFLTELRNDTDENLNTLKSGVDVITMKGHKEGNIIYKQPDKVELTLSIQMSMERYELLMTILHGEDL